MTGIITNTLLWATFSTMLVALPCIPLSYVLARHEFPGKAVLSALVGLPMVLPPTAIGYVLLLILADSGPLGRDVIGIDLNILLSWKAVVLACGVMSAPLMIRASRVAFEQVNPRLEEMARTLGYGRGRTFLKITLPLARRGLTAALILAFSRALGEFGATVVVAGNIPGRTQTIASAIYSAQQSGNSQRAGFLVGIALVVGFTSILLTEWLSRRPERSLNRTRHT